jgi:hypothetical protein
MLRIGTGLAGLSAALIITALGCKNDQYIKPPPVEHQYNLPPVTDPRYSNPPEFPDDTLNKKNKENLDDVFKKGKPKADPSGGFGMSP